MGPVALRTLATSLPAALTRACILNNPLGEGVNEIIKVFEETPRLRTLCGFEEGVQQIDWKDSGKGVADVALLSAELKACRAVAASVEVIKLDGNPIGAPVVSVKPGAEAGVDVKKGVFAAVGGRFGEICDDRWLEDLQEVKLRWLDDGTESEDTKVDKLTSVVASQTDLIEDYSHIQALGEAISEAQVQHISMAQCLFTSATLTTFVQSVCWDTAAVYEVNISMNPIGVDGAKALGDVISTSSLKCLIIGPRSTRLPVNDGEVTELNFEGQGFSATEVTLVAAATSTLAAVTKVDVRGTKADSSALEALQSAAPDGCDVVCE